MFSKELINRELQLYIELIKTMAHPLNFDTWEYRCRFDELIQFVSPLMTKDQANKLNESLLLDLPFIIQTFKSKQPQKELTHRVVIDLQREKEYLYMNCFLSSIRKFPHVPWLFLTQDSIKATYPIKYAQYYPLLIKALEAFTLGSDLKCFTYCYNQGELVVTGMINNIRKMIAQHKIQCMSLIRYHVTANIPIEVISSFPDATEMRSIRPNSIHVEILDGKGLPCVTVKIRDESALYFQIKKVFPDFEVYQGGYTYEEKQSIGIKVNSIEKMCALLTEQLRQKIQNCRSDFCKTVWMLPSLKLSNLNFFPIDVTRRIALNVCSEETYLTQTEAWETILKIEASKKEKEVNEATSLLFVEPVSNLQL